MLNCTVLFNCIGYEIKFFLSRNKYFKKKYNVSYISINDYMFGELKQPDFTNEHKILLKNTELLIILNNDKSKLTANNSKINLCKNINIKSITFDYNSNNIINKYINKNCKIIKIPFYRTSIYLQDQNEIFNKIDNEPYFKKNIFIQKHLK
jgi:hypothetical protein